VGIKQNDATQLYTGFYRLGDASPFATGPGENQGENGNSDHSTPIVAPIVRTHTEECDEGLMTKFCQRVPHNAAHPRPESAEQQGPPSPLGPLGLDIESVIIPMEGTTGRKTTTLCVSSQVGCAMGCEFCETAQMGLVRNLTAAEIVGQWWAARHVQNARPDGVVFMGMGEPLDNLNEVLQAIACLADHRGPCVAMSNITISTVGRVDGLRRLIDVVQQHGWRRLGLALSVNAPNDEVRSAIMPLNRKWGMAELQETMLDLCAARGAGRKLMFEYVLIPGVNDSAEHAQQIAEWMMPFGNKRGELINGRVAAGRVGMLNVIPYNPRRNSPWPAPNEDAVDEFVKRVGSYGVFVKRRRTKGRTQMAACGQLGAAEIRGRKFVGVTTGRTENTTNPGEQG
jgi:23S rRNA (adenine2503-C2)-methyltransferase